MHDILKIKRMNANFYMIEERIAPTMAFTIAVVIGKERAAVIDTGMGLTPDLRDIIQKITQDKPLVCLLTHSDPDHIGGAPLFGHIYMNPLEQGLQDGVLDMKSRLRDIRAMSNYNTEMLDYAEKNLVPESELTVSTIADGDLFDLGGRTLQAITLPGHTAGSTCFLDRENALAFTGDAITRFPLLCLERCPPLHVYLHALKRFAEIAGTQNRLFCGHSIRALPKSILSDLICGCQEIIDGKTQSDRPQKLFLRELEDDRTRPMRHRTGKVNIQYNANRI